MVFHFRGDFKTAEKYTPAIQELETASDRAAALVGASLAEMALDGALQVHLHQSEAIRSLGGFAKKIELGFLTGLYGEQARKELVDLKDIRNKFAHNMEVNSFDTDVIRDRAMRLELCERYTVSEDDAKTELSERAHDLEKPISEWDYWFSVLDREAKLAAPRGRFIVTIQVMHFGLSIANETAMPAPPFG